MDFASILTLLGQAGQIATAHLQAKNFLINTEMRSEQLKITTANHEQQLKLFHLQQEYRLRDYNIDQVNKMDLETYRSLLKVHEQRCLECKVPPYPLGGWRKSTILPNESAPFVIICTNTYQGDSPFKNEDVIKPLHKVYNSVKDYNSVNSDLLTITETRQYFNTDEDARNFFIRELQCPVILVYSTFIGSSLTISVLFAGITNDQNKPNINLKWPSFKPTIIRLWEMDYTLIYNLRSKKKSNSENTSDENPFQWKKTLDNIIEAYVGIKVQSLIDEYFQNSYQFQPQSLQYLNDRSEKYGNKTEWEEFAREIKTRYDIISERQRSLFEHYKSLLPKDRNLQFTIVVFGRPAIGKSSLINAFLKQNELLADLKYDERAGIYKSGIFQFIEVTILIPQLNDDDLLTKGAAANLHLFVIDKEPTRDEIEKFDLIYSSTPKITKIVFANKEDHFEFMPRKDAEIVKLRIKQKMLKYCKDAGSLIFGAAEIYEGQNERMVPQSNNALNECILKELMDLKNQPN